MPVNISKKMADAIANGLRRKKIRICSYWAEECRVMGEPIPGKWTFKYHPWLREVHDSEAEETYIQKAAQMGFTETAMNRSFFSLDQLKRDVLYVLPTKNPDASDFSSARFDTALELSEHLASLFTSTKNVGHKKAGSANLYIRGSRARSQLKSIPVGVLIMDEIDEFDPAAISLAIERTSGQFNFDIWGLSTPTIDTYGINLLYDKTTKEHFMFKCPHCGRMTELIYPDCLVITAEHTHDPKILESHIICKECKHKLNHDEKHKFLADGVWEPTQAGSPFRGFYINQLYSSTVKPSKIAEAAINARTDIVAEQELYNSKLGLPHIVKGARVLEDDFKGCMDSYRCGDISKHKNSLVTIGIDVGSYLHVEVCRWVGETYADTSDINSQAKGVVLDILELELGKAGFPELDPIIRKYRPFRVVIDANPERRSAIEFARRWFGLVYLCFYGNNVRGRDINPSEDGNFVTVDRTSWLDLSLGRFRNGTINLPLDTPQMYKEHIKNLVRIYRENKQGEMIASYKSTGADHFGHARNYAEIALGSTKFAGLSNVNWGR
jgi:hypothetical protein